MRSSSFIQISILLQRSGGELRGGGGKEAGLNVMFRPEGTSQLKDGFIENVGIYEKKVASFYMQSLLLN